MRATLRLLASVSRSAQYLEPGAPTGLTGLYTHATPRSSLLYLYNSTLEQLKTLPEHSVYRKSTEALTKHRMSIVEAVKPEGLSEWQQRVSKLVEDHPEAFRRVKAINGEGHNIVYREPPPEEYFKTEDEKINAPYMAKPQLEGPRLEEEVADRGDQLARDVVGERINRLQIEAEPPLTLEQVGEIETKIGAGLIEEIIQVAEGEKALVETMQENKV